MNCKKVEALLLAVLVMAALIPLHAQRRESPSAREQQSAENSSTGTSLFKKGDLPPGNAANLSLGQARTMLEDSLNKKFAGTMLWKGGEKWIFSKTTDIHVRSSSFAFSASLDDEYKRFKLHDEASVIVDLRTKVKIASNHCISGSGERGLLGYLSVVKAEVLSPQVIYSVNYLLDQQAVVPCFQNLLMFAWTDEVNAQNFADAFNRLLYSARQNDLDPEFTAAAKEWRESSVRPPLSPEADRERILAENALEEKEFASAVQHYEATLEIQPMWPAGWFNVAMIYAELKQYSDAGFAMKHYLELAPNASDAKSAREQMFIWEDKAKQ